MAVGYGGSTSRADTSAPTRGRAAVGHSETPSFAAEFPARRPSESADAGERPRIDGHRARFAAALMCRVLRVARAGYYDWRARQAAGMPTARTAADAPLAGQIRAVHGPTAARAGTPSSGRRGRASGASGARA